MKRHALGVLSAVFLATFSGFCHAAPMPGLTLPEVLQHIEDSQRAIQTLRFHFSETIGKAAASDTIVGEVAFKRPSHLRVDQSHPEKQTLWSDGDQFWLFSPAEGQELTGPWKPWLARSGFPAPLLNFISDFSAEAWATRYDVLFGGYDDHLYKILFKPKAAGDSRMELWVSDDTFLPVRGRLLAPNAPIEVLFKTMQTNPTLTDGFFTPTVPKGTPVVPLPS